VFRHLKNAENLGALNARRVRIPSHSLITFGFCTIVNELVHSNLDHPESKLATSTILNMP
jgi:hypothetical protein